MGKPVVESTSRVEILNNRPTHIHNITLHLNNDELTARQINNLVPLTSDQEAYWKNKMHSQNITMGNIRPEILTSDSDQIRIQDSVPIILFSSYGAKDGAKMVEFQPSEGIWTLADSLARSLPQAAPLCIDPNLQDLDITLNELEKFVRPGQKTIIGFSVLADNLQNDTELIAKVHSRFPKAIKIVGGVGADALDLIPTNSGKIGIKEALPIDMVIPGPAILEMKMLVDRVSSLPDQGKVDLLALSNEFGGLYTDITYPLIINELAESRSTSKKSFVPYAHHALFYPKSYAEAHEETQINKSSSKIAGVLSDNQCDEGCWFCSTPKTKYFNTQEKELTYVFNTISGADIVAFYNNDLSNDPKKTIWILNQLTEKGLNQPKHGKMRANRYLPNLLDVYGRANFKRMAVGVESFSQTIRNGLSKDDFTEEVINLTLSYLLKLDITPEINLMLFSPNETKKTLMETTQKALYWVNRGAIVNVNLGIRAMVNSPSVKKILTNLKSKEKADTLKYFDEHFDFEQVGTELNNQLLLPIQWKVKDPKLQELKKSIREERLKIMTVLFEKENETVSQNYLTIESYIALILLANNFQFEGYKSENEVITNIGNYIDRLRGNIYVGI